jgi:hypothetical protein
MAEELDYVPMPEKVVSEIEKLWPRERRKRQAALCPERVGAISPCVRRRAFSRSPHHVGRTAPSTKEQMVMSDPNRLQSKAVGHGPKVHGRELDCRSLNQEPKYERQRGRTKIVATSLRSLRSWFRSLDWSDKER